MSDNIAGYVDLGSGWRRPAEEFDLYGEAFHRAAQRLTQDFVADPAHHPLAACPIIFLYRHAVELYLKGILRLGESLLRTIGQQPSFDASAFKGHDLRSLLPPLGEVFRVMNWSDSYEEIAHFIEHLDCLDSTSSAFRYPTDKKDRASLPKTLILDINLFAYKAGSCLENLSNTSQSIVAELAESREHQEG